MCVKRLNNENSPNITVMVMSERVLLAVGKSRAWNVLSIHSTFFRCTCREAQSVIGNRTSDVVTFLCCSRIRQNSGVGALAATNQSSHELCYRFSKKVLDLSQTLNTVSGSTKHRAIGRTWCPSVASCGRIVTGSRIIPFARLIVEVGASQIKIVLVVA